MIVSTSSHNLQLTDDICAYVEDTLRGAFGDNVDHVLSVDTQLEAVRSVRDRQDMKAVVRVDLRNHRPIVTEIQDNNLYTAVRRGASDSARAVSRELQHSRKVTAQRQPSRFHAFARYSASNI